MGSLTDAEEVREFLVGEGITGSRGVVSFCPVAVLLRSKLEGSFLHGIPPHVSVSTTQIRVRNELIDTPRPVRAFIRKFDAGEYPELIKEGW